VPLLLAFAAIREPDRRKAASAASAAGLFAYLRAEQRLFLPLFIGNACTVAISYAMISWAPAVLAREHGWSVADVGLRIGVIMLTAAPAGVILGGLLADRWRGTLGMLGFARVMLLAPLLALPFLIALPFAASGAQLFALLLGIQFCTGLTVGVGPASIQPLANPHLRGRVSAVYVFAVNLIGLGIGPVAIGVLSDRVFAGDDALSQALAAYALLMAMLSILFLLRFRKALEASSASPAP
jgi:MFS family permease